MSFVQRKINLKFQLGEGSFGETGANAVEVTGLRVSSTIVKAGGPSKGRAQVQVYGLTLSKMNTLSTLGLVPTLVRKNTITITAGDDANGMATVFIGTIQDAWFDPPNAPDVAFNIDAFAGGIESVQPAEPSSFKGSADVATIMSSIATKMGAKFENNAVSVKLANPYFSGAALQQAQQCAQAAGVKMVFDNGTLAIWTTSGSRGGQIPLLSPQTGMEGYPVYTSHGVRIKCLFNPSISFGGKIKVQSDLKPACGEWIVYNLTHNLDSQVPRGRWHSTLQAARPGVTVVS